MKVLIAVLLMVCGASAQTPQWTHTSTNGIFNYAGTGNGGFVYSSFTPSYETALLKWINRTGAVIYSQSFPMGPTFGGISIERVNPSFVRFAVGKLDSEGEIEVT